MDWIFYKHQNLRHQSTTLVYMWEWGSLHALHNWFLRILESRQKLLHIPQTFWFIYIELYNCSHQIEEVFLSEPCWYSKFIFQFFISDLKLLKHHAWNQVVFVWHLYYKCVRLEPNSSIMVTIKLNTSICDININAC